MCVTDRTIGTVIVIGLGAAVEAVEAFRIASPGDSLVTEVTSALGTHGRSCSAAPPPARRRHVRMPFGDLEAPGALLAAAESISRHAGGFKELILMATGPDANSMAVTNTSLVSMAKLGLRKHVLLLTDSWTTCEQLNRPPGSCFWSSRMLRTRPADSLTLQKFWDYRFRFYYIKKKYMALLVQGGYSVLQADTDTVWIHDPFRMLRQMRSSSLVFMRDVGLANAGIMYARPGSSAALRVLEEVAWRVQLFQNHPEIVGRIVPFARPPYYANSDDQTLLNDAIVGAVLGNRTFMGSTARYEARNRYNPKAPEWSQQAESRQERAEMRLLWRAQKSESIAVPWGEGQGENRAGRRVRYMTLPIGGGDHIALAPRTLFAHLPFTAAAAITHLTAARGFTMKVAALRRIGKWDPLGNQEDPANGRTTDGAADDVADGTLDGGGSDTSLRPAPSQLGGGGKGGGARAGGGRGHAGGGGGRGGGHAGGGGGGGRGGAHGGKGRGEARKVKPGAETWPSASLEEISASKAALREEKLQKMKRMEITLPVTEDTQRAAL